MYKYLVEFEIIDDSGNVVEKTKIDVILDDEATSNIIGDHAIRVIDIKYPNKGYKTNILSYKNI